MLPILANHAVEALHTLYSSQNELSHRTQTNPGAPILEHWLPPNYPFINTSVKCLGDWNGLCSLHGIKLSDCTPNCPRNTVLRVFQDILGDPLIIDQCMCNKESYDLRGANNCQITDHQISIIFKWDNNETNKILPEWFAVTKLTVLSSIWQKANNMRINKY